MKVLGYVCAFVAGTAAGCAGTYYYLTKIKKIEYEVVTEPKPKLEEIEEKEEPTVAIEERAFDDMAVTSAVSKAMDEKLSEIMAGNYVEGNSFDEVIDYTKFTAKEIAEDMGLQTAEVREVTPEEIKEQSPHMISEGQFTNNRFNCVTLCLYEGDGTVVDETNGMDAIVDNIDDYIGSDLLAEFADDKDLDEAYIFNPKNGLYYEIYKRLEKYSEIIGMGTETEVQNE